MTNPSELAAIANIRCSELSDSTVQLSYAVGEKNWDKVAQILHSHAQCLHILAGTVKDLLPQAEAVAVKRKVA